MGAAPYGIYDLNRNEGYVNVGITHDTGECSVASIRRWWEELGQTRYPDATALLITADGGGSNGYRLRLWKKELQALADATKLAITVCHYPPGTSKWNKIEHRLFSYISINWKGKPLTSYEVIINLIANTTTTTGLKVYAVLDDHEYALKKKVTNEEMKGIRLDAGYLSWGMELYDTTERVIKGYLFQGPKEFFNGLYKQILIDSIFSGILSIEHRPQ